VPEVGTRLHHFGESDNSHELRVSGSPPPARDSANGSPETCRCAV